MAILLEEVAFGGEKGVLLSLRTVSPTLPGFQCSHGLTSSGYALAEQKAQHKHRSCASKCTVILVECTVEVKEKNLSRRTNAKFSQDLHGSCFHHYKTGTIIFKQG